MSYDVFISYAAEDKDEVARPLAVELTRRGFRVWFDETALTVGDRLRRSIDRGLRQSRFGVVILSRNFFAKEWPNRELDGLFGREDGSAKVILPVWHRVTGREVARHSPILATRIAVSTGTGIEHVADELQRAMQEASGFPQEEFPRPIKDPMASIRVAVLLAPGRFELTRCLFEVDHYLHEHPNDPDARLLRDEILRALEFEGRSRPAAARHGFPRRWLGFSASALGLFILIVTMLRGLEPEEVQQAASREGDRVMVDVAPDDALEFRLGWRDGNDLDLSVVLPSGLRIWYGAAPPSGVTFDRDVRWGPASERVMIAAPTEGRYMVAVENFAGPVPVEYRLSVLVDGKQRRVFVGSLDDRHGSYTLQVLVRR